MCQCQLIDCNKCITTVYDVHSRLGCEYMGIGSIWKPSVLFIQVCYEPKMPLKIKFVNLFKIESFQIHILEVQVQGWIWKSVS